MGGDRKKFLLWVLHTDSHDRDWERPETDSLWFALRNPHSGRPCSDLHDQCDWYGRAALA